MGKRKGKREERAGKNRERNKNTEKNTERNKSGTKKAGEETQKKNGSGWEKNAGKERLNNKRRVIKT